MGVGESPRRALHATRAMSLVDPTQDILLAAMRGAQMRQTLLTSNLANSGTPGYQRRDVNFQATLQSALANGVSASDVGFTPVIANQGLGPDGNGVSPDQESANLAENAITYDSVVQVLGARNSIMQWAMGAR